MGRGRISILSVAAVLVFLARVVRYCMGSFVYAGQMELLMLPRMIDLLEKKWANYASLLFLQRFFVLFSYLLIFAGKSPLYAKIFVLLCSSLLCCFVPVPRQALSLVGVV